MFDVEKIRKDFPILDVKINGKKLVYLDSAATSQKPLQVIEEVSDFYKKKNSNVARGLYRLAEQATMEYEGVREKVQRFINAESPREIILTRNTTEGSNVIMRGWGEKYLRKGDRMVTTILEHHSNFVPWQQLAKRTGASLEVVNITDDGELDEAELEAKMKGARFVAVSAASNVTGTLPDIKGICAMAHENDAVSVVDGAQSVPSMPTDVKKIGCDFLTFSGHKMLAPFGSGVLYGREELLEKMDPLLYGSEMIRSVTIEETEWNDLPLKFEAGTHDVGCVVGLGAAIDYLKRIGLESIRSHEESLVSYALERLSEVEGLRILGPKDARRRGALVAFTLDGVHPHDVAAMLDEEAVCVRSGHHCAMPLHDRLGIPASTRASFYVYSKKEEVDMLAESLKKIKKVFG
jgi:cysteine desulfurase/selenocysteine lyase